ncbi:unnamed protein product [Amoebophrya sp. A120]|nr:unnamed protein product [Amoebophrya sp. A120]|eukprot:GSA120T00008641001.1
MANAAHSEERALDAFAVRSQASQFMTQDFIPYPDEDENQNTSQSAPAVVVAVDEQDEPRAVQLVGTSDEAEVSEEMGEEVEDGSIPDVSDAEQHSYLAYGPRDEIESKEVENEREVVDGLNIVGREVEEQKFFQPQPSPSFPPLTQNYTQQDVEALQTSCGVDFSQLKNYPQSQVEADRFYDFVQEFLEAQQIVKTKEVPGQSKAHVGDALLTLTLRELVGTRGAKSPHKVQITSSNLLSHYGLAGDFEKKRTKDENRLQSEKVEEFVYEKVRGNGEVFRCLNKLVDFVGTLKTHHAAAAGAPAAPPRDVVEDRGRSLASKNGKSKKRVRITFREAIEEAMGLKLEIITKANEVEDETGEKEINVLPKESCPTEAAAVADHATNSNSKDPPSSSRNLHAELQLPAQGTTRAASAARQARNKTTEVGRLCRGQWTTLLQKLESGEALPSTLPAEDREVMPLIPFAIGWLDRQQTDRFCDLQGAQKKAITLVIREHNLWCLRNRADPRYAAKNLATRSS